MTTVMINFVQQFADRLFLGEIAAAQAISPVATRSP